LNSFLGQRNREQNEAKPQIRFRVSIQTLKKQLLGLAEVGFEPMKHGHTSD